MKRQGSELIATEEASHVGMTMSLSQSNLEPAQKQLGDARKERQR
jgi:hypothetical protein